ncbi:outer membrane beta-barrel family protein [Pedobacter sp.]|uniref:outer membrane beta-barrel family protein n=1 Tax=Pedobacter sp. TaxID=1411316 RepID=UPI003D7F4473
MKTLLLLLLASSCYCSIYAQNSSIVKGYVVDTAYTTRLVNASVSVLNAKDSTLVNFSRVNSAGSFQIGDLKPGKFILMVTYPSYADYVDRFQIDSTTKEKDFGKINLTLKAKLLHDVIIRGTAGAIKIKGDTTEFNAAAFTIQPNSKVEDLLKQLPGIQVDKDGKITAQGQTVSKVLVDGEEFFGDDPTLVTKNIRGDMVDKVQLFDKKSDQATFTGIDDGVQNKTLNIKLKEDKKQGYFGKVDLGVGTDDMYAGQGMFNYFKGKKKFSGYGTLGNTGVMGLGWEDGNKYGAASGMQFNDDGMIYINNSQDALESFSGRYNGEGIPVARTGGLHYDAKWNDEKESINTNYKIGSLDVTGEKNTRTQNNLPSGLIRSTSDQVFDNFAFRQKLDGIYEIKLDTTSSLKVSVEGTLRNNEAISNYQSSSSRGNDVLLNTGNREVSNDTDEKIFRATAFWNKRFKKKGRSISLNVSGNLNESDANGFLKSENGFYNQNGLLDSTNVIDQYKVNNISSKVFTSNLTYSEPLSTNFSVVLNYGLGINNADQDRRSYNAVSPGRYTQLDSAFSNNYKLEQLSNQVGAIFNYKGDKTIINFGTKVSAVNFDQLDVYSGQRMERNFANWNPQAWYQYKFSQQKSFRLNYYGRTNQPTIDQIQPVRVNTDPLNVFIGNPDLRPSFTNQVSATFSSYKVLSQRNIWLSVNYSTTSNPIVSNTLTDSAGKNTYQSINLSGKQTSNINAYMDYGLKIKPLDMYLGFNASANGNTYYNYVNNELNETNTYSLNGGVYISKNKVKKYSFYLRWSPNYQISESSLQRNLNNNGWGYNATGSIQVFLPGKMELGTDGQYQYNAATESFNDEFKRFIWNAALTKKFLKAENLRLSLSGRDLLNQNKGFSRFAYENRFTETNTTTIKRYFMVSLIWDFNKMGGSAPQK